MLTAMQALILGFPCRNERGLWQADPAYFICSVHLLLERSSP
jgi:hypothetical protein